MNSIVDHLRQAWLTIKGQAVPHPQEAARILGVQWSDVMALARGGPRAVRGPVLTAIAILAYKLSQVKGHVSESTGATPLSRAARWHIAQEDDQEDDELPHVEYRTIPTDIEIIDALSLATGVPMDKIVNLSYEYPWYMFHNLMDHTYSRFGIDATGARRIRAAMVLVMFIQRSWETGQRTSVLPRYIRSREDACAYLMGAAADWGEGLYVIYLDKSGAVLEVSQPSLGDRRNVGINYSFILANAKRLRASFMIMAHNHPEGYVLPSGSDLVVLERCRLSAKIWDVQILGSLIMSQFGCRAYYWDDNAQFVPTQAEEAGGSMPSGEREPWLRQHIPWIAPDFLARATGIPIDVARELVSRYTWDQLEVLDSPVLGLSADQLVAIRAAVRLARLVPSARLPDRPMPSEDIMRRIRPDLLPQEPKDISIIAYREVEKIVSLRVVQWRTIRDTAAHALRRITDIEERCYMILAHILRDMVTNIIEHYDPHRVIIVVGVREGGPDTEYAMTVREMIRNIVPDFNKLISFFAYNISQRGNT